MPKGDAEISVAIGHFTTGGIRSGSSGAPNLPQELRDNKTVGLKTVAGADADGN
jgi:hypothetical protein